MSYVNTFESFISSDYDYTEDIIYMLMDLEDDGFKIEINTNDKGLDYYRVGRTYNVKITNSSNFSKVSIQHYLNHLISYMSENGFKCIINSVESSEDIPFKSNINLRFIRR